MSVGRKNVLMGLIFAMSFSQALSGQNRVASCQGGESIDPFPQFMAQTETDLFGKVGSDAEIKQRVSDLSAKDLAQCQNSSGTAYRGCDYAVEAQLVLQMLGDKAFQQSNAPITNDQALVTALYAHLLRRKPDQNGFQFHLNSLAQNHDRVSAIATFLISNEYRARFECYAGLRDQINLGINGHPLTQAVYSDSIGVSYDDQLTKVRESGSRWYRFDVSAVSTGAEFAKMDSLLSKAQARGVQLLPVLMPPVSLAHDDTSTIYQKAYAGAVNFVTRYKNSIHVWELANEEDIYSMHASGDPGWPDGTPSGERTTDYNSQKYAAVVAMLRGLADGVRAADGSALRIIDFAGWLHTGFLQRLEDDRVPYDIVGIHWYQNYGEITCPGQSLPCPAKLQHFNVVQRLQSISNSKPMWMTETNYSPTPGDTEQMNLARRQEYLGPTLQSYLRTPALYPFQTAMIYELLDEPNLPSGVVQTQVGLFAVKSLGGGKFALDSPKPEYHTVQALFTH